MKRFIRRLLRSRLLGYKQSSYNTAPFCGHHHTDTVLFWGLFWEHDHEGSKQQVIGVPGKQLLFPNFTRYSEWKEFEPWSFDKGRILEAAKAAFNVWRINDRYGINPDVNWDVTRQTFTRKLHAS